MEEERKALYERLNKTKDQEDYIPVIETEKGNHMIWENEIAKCSRESRRRYNSYLESKGPERFDKLVAAIELDREKKKGIWFGLEGFTKRLESENIEIIKESIKKYK